MAIKETTEERVERRVQERKRELLKDPMFYFASQEKIDDELSLTLLDEEIAEGLLD